MIFAERLHCGIHSSRRVRNFLGGSWKTTEDLMDFCCDVPFDACGRHTSELYHILSGPRESVPKMVFSSCQISTLFFFFSFFF